ncbi:MAG TPA: class I SAM-dependent methyltransferase [Streptosporangiaceae bacterium]|nr:class I SAM-dependent methyltransferase [Streptosporangiaceae bacterium]
MTDHATDRPELVQAAERLARELGFPLTRQEAGPDRHSACLPGVGGFLAMLAAGAASIAELGTGTGVGTAWMVSAMPADGRLITVEIDENQAATVRQLFSADRRVEVITGDAAAEVASRGPFDLIFADSGIRDDAGFNGLVDLLNPGGRIVMDDVTPVAALTPGSPLQAHDLKRRFFASPRLVSTEVVLTDLANSLLVGTRVS